MRWAVIVCVGLLAGCGPSASEQKTQKKLNDFFVDWLKNHGETEFHIVLPQGGEIVEFVAGMGPTQDAAIDDSLANFTLTTFHVVYKCFLNDADPHQEVKKMEVGGVQRQVAFGDLYLRGTEGEKIDLASLRPAIEDAIAELELDERPHWIKIVYGQSQGDVITAAATLDNDDESMLTEAITALDWPKTDGFYMAKQFIVVK